MTNNIYITYDCSGAAAYSFWKQFFMMCRAWVSGHKIDHMEEDVPDITEAESLHLYFLSNDQLLAIKQNALKEHVFYFVNERNYYHGKSCQFRRDILVYDWKKRDTFLKALNQMAGGENENYSRLIEIYMDNSLWMSAWLYHELACDEKTEWDAWIVKNSKAALESLDVCIEENKAKDIWHYEFMHLYCGYLTAAAERRDPEEREEKVQQLLQEGELLSEKTGWQPALCELCAAISCLSPLENKYSIAYYKAILKYEKKS